ncbi:hypothetical protein AXG93_4697s1250 [Marchantia polymorpha subsp. ruderalis]|uniref:Uncharacterized protein n=1 Tax=Marchantia polymorpha subsp. ruderalis TaxID=1480154 RepID=A0A176VNK3_MARPO|nr:hypothetical protein AXG93_4697s1250 [Marchantia polymorpha subsp. ruderalis]
MVGNMRRGRIEGPDVSAVLQHGGHRERESYGMSGVNAAEPLVASMAIITEHRIEVDRFSSRAFSNHFPPLPPPAPAAGATLSLHPRVPIFAVAESA